MKELLESLQIEPGRGRAAAGTRRLGGVHGARLAWLGPAVALALAVGGWSWARSRPVLVETVRVEAPAADAPVATLTAGGYVRSPRVVYVVPRVPGRIVSLNVREGDVLQAGDLVAQIDTGDLDQQVAEARARLALAQATLEEHLTGSRPEEVAEARARVEGIALASARAARELARSRALFDSGLISAQALDAVATEHGVAARNLEAARQALSLVEKGPREEERRMARAARDAARAEAARAANRLGWARVTAPVAGRVLRKLRNPGDFVSPEVPYMEGYETLAAGSPVVSLADLGAQEIAVDINETEISKVRLGQPVEVVPGAYPDETLRGTVAQISPRADKNKNTIEVKVALQDPPRLLQVDMSARLRFLERPGTSLPREMQIPSRAVLEKDGRPFVFVASGSRATVRGVGLGERRGETATVTSGLAPGETVIVSRLSELADGSRVRLR